MHSGRYTKILFIPPQSECLRGLCWIQSVSPSVCVSVRVSVRVHNTNLCRELLTFCFNRMEKNLTINIEIFQDTISKCKLFLVDVLMLFVKLRDLRVHCCPRGFFLYLVNKSLSGTITKR